jgi:Tfp pilus assembly protein PilN
MPNINLIAARRAEKKRLEKLTRNLFFGLAASVGGFIVLSSYLGLQQLAMSTQLKEAEQALERLKPKKDRVAAIEADMKVLEPKLNTLAQAKRDTLRWPALMQSISQSVPGSTWLTNVGAQGGGDTPISLRLSGVSVSQSQAADTVLLLQKQPIFSDVSLVFTSTNPAQGTEPARTTFEATAVLKGSGKQEDEEADKGKGGTINADKRQKAVNEVSRNDGESGETPGAAEVKHG